MSRICAAFVAALLPLGPLAAQDAPEETEEVAEDLSGDEASPEPPPPEEAEPSPLRVVVAGNAPFVTGQETPGGIAVELWEAVAEELDRPFTMTNAESVPEALSRVEAGEADVAVGPISITAERAEHVSFTQPYYESSLSILAVAGSTGMWERVRPFFSGAFLGGAGALLLVLVIVGFLMWFAERKANDDFPRSPLAGTGTGVWLALVTMTTVGYGDRVPVTSAGRVIAGVWMLISMLTVSSLTAFLATALTVASLDTAEIGTADALRQRKVAAVRGTTGATFARTHGARIVAADDVSTAIDRVESEDAEAVVYDRPMLLWELQQREDATLVVAEATYDPQSYGFAVHFGDATLARRLDVALLELHERGDIDEIVDTWLGGR